ncbi:acyl-CoA N-acyltransferase [Usnea florida]
MPIGQIHLHPPPSESHHRKASLSINILPAHQNHGYGTEALQWVLQWGFQTAGLHRVELFCFEWNEGARRLYERVGFRLEGRRREALWFEGRWWDLLEFGLLEGEWRGRSEG